MARPRSALLQALPPAQQLPRRDMGPAGPMLAIGVKAIGVVAVVMKAIGVVVGAGMKKVGAISVAGALIIRVAADPTRRLGAS
ncbi:hypothetical protein SAMN05519104_5388 [Rhizobiales bacterium GAS188]|nr:hypothetical protein SAMN05519104_5388 [Rhizobiales bacterium GAS188]